jgi:hypothetical protein
MAGADDLPPCFVVSGCAGRQRPTNCHQLLLHIRVREPLRGARLKENRR